MKIFLKLVLAATMTLFLVSSCSNELPESTIPKSENISFKKKELIMSRPKIIPMLTAGQRIIYTWIPIIGMLLLSWHAKTPTWTNWIGAAFMVSGLFLASWILYKRRNISWARYYFFGAVVIFILTAVVLTIGVKYLQ